MAVEQEQVVYEPTSNRIEPFSGESASDVQVESHFGGRLLLLRGFFSAAECDYYRQQFVDMGLQHVHEIGYRDNYRNNERVSAMGQALARQLFERVLPHVAAEVTVDDGNEDMFFPGCKGVWRAHSCNDCFRFCRYLPGGHFSPHIDGEFVRSTEQRSLKTMMLYLNGDFDGGYTNMLDDSMPSVDGGDGKRHGAPEAVLLQVKPEQGMAIVFDHKMLHEGSALLTGVKDILRTEIIYERQPGSCEVGGVEQEFLRLFYLAEQYEGQNNMELAIQTYKQCRKLDAKLAAKYGL